MLSVLVVVNLLLSFALIGRLRVLQEMVNGTVVKDGWRSEEVHQALDLCLSCKGCASDCPTGVDMATYKAEFFSHYYKGRIRPLPAYTMGWIYWWAGIGSMMPRVANAFMRMPGLKTIGGIAGARRMPQFAMRTFREQWAKRGTAPRAGAKRTITQTIRQLPSYLRLLLGLMTDSRVAIVDKALQRMGGALELANATGGGLVAHIRLKRAP